jgi:signal transduction histidine kinase
MERKEHLDKIANSDGEEKYLAIIKYAWFLRQKDPLESAKQAKIVLKYARAQKKINFEFSALTYLCYAHFYHSDLEEAGRWADELEKTGKKYDNTRARGSAYSMKARIALQQNNTSDALESMLVALDYYLQTNSTEDLISCYNALGMIHIDRDEMTDAEHYLQLALRKAEETNARAQHSIRVNISNLLYRQQKFEESLNINIKSLDYFREQGMSSSMATVLLNMGLCHRFLGDNEAALENMKKSYKLCKEINDPKDLGLVANAMAKVYILRSDWDNAQKYLEEGMKLAEENNLKINIASNYSAYTEYHEKRGEFELANKYLHKIVAIKEEIDKENNQEKISILETQYKTQIYRMKSAELDKKNQAMNNQVTELNKTLENLQKTYQTLQGEFQEAVNKLNTQGDLLSTQSRMAVMGEMISAIAHQWKQPLNVIWVLAQAIGEAWEFEELDDEFLESQLKRIGEQVMYMSETVDDFRNFFKQDYVRDFKVAETIEKSINLVSYMINKNEIKLIKELDEKCHLNGNPNELSQVIINIINNAREAILRGKIIVPEIRIRMNCHKERINITIYNKGNHIKAENLEKIFEPYYTTRGKEGTGLGLQICRQIIENKYNGTIIANNCDGGVEFVIEMPKLQRKNINII